MPQAGVIILCHGSRGERGIVEVPESLKRITDGVKPLLPPGMEVTWAALQFNHPNLEEAVASLVAEGVQRIVIMPYFLFPGRHITEGIPQLMGMLESRYPAVQFMSTNTLGNGEHFVSLVADRLEETAPELWSDTPTFPTSPEAIEQQSMEIIERLLPPMPSISAEERVVIKRLVHTSGDPQVAGSVKFSPSAIPDGLGAIAKGSPIYTDVQMVAAGINKRLAESMGCFVSCAMDEAKGQNRVQEGNTTRAAAAMRSLGKKIDGAIVAIGNAPTALMALLDLIDNDGMKPALIVGMPVGFVQARESKEELIRRDVPYITIAGTRGGSAMAAATVNALLRIAKEGSNT